MRVAPVDAKRGGGLSRAVSALSGRHALVVGLGRTGVAASQFLARCGARVMATDIQPESGIPAAAALRDLGVEIVADGHPLDALKAVELVVVSPGVARDVALLEEARSMGAEVISEVELAYRFIDAPIVAVTGTNGKTTTTTLIGRVLERAGKTVFVGGNIGTPAIEYVDSDSAADVCVLEVSSFHLETTKTFNPRVGALLNVTEDHLDRYSSFEEYAETKFRLFENQGQDDLAVVNSGDPVIARRLKESGAGDGRLVRFNAVKTLKDGLYLRRGDIVYASAGQEEVYPGAGFGLKGVHNMENMMAAIASTRALGAPRETIIEELSEFRGLSHRMEVVREVRGVSYIDDSKGTNVGALAMALKGLRRGVILIAGGRDKGGDYGALRDPVTTKVKLLILIGEARMKMRDALRGSAETVLAGSLEEAVALAGERALPGDTVLLSPACSSFDMFRDYKERGERFRALVEAL
jgi:UDP-N-acetylmuramoylalanine--D-glutamate ligase